MDIAGISLLLVDSAVENVQQLLQTTNKHVKVAVIDRTQNGVETLIWWLQQFPNLQQVHILAHGAPGRVFLGNTQLSQDTLQSYSETLRYIRQCRRIAQSPLDLLLYSCNVAAGKAGNAFVESLHRLTGANIAASSVPVGNAALGGTWHLDTQTSVFPVSLPFAAAAAYRYPGLLAPVSISSIIAGYTDLPDNTSSYTANEVGNPDGDATANELYTHNFPVGTNNNLVISGFTAASSTYDLVQLVDEVRLRRIPNPNVSNAGGRQVFWYEVQNLNSASNVLDLRPSRINTMEQALLGNVINRGVDNLFANQGDNNINNIERIDFIASGGLTAPTAAASLDDIGFLLLERGGNDPLTIAAITAVDASGNPTAYGPLQVVPASAWGASSFNMATAVLNDMGTGGDPRFSSNIPAQNIRGVFLSYSALGISAGQTFFGYSVFPNDVGTDLVGLSNAVLNSSSASGQGGLDLVAGGGIFVKNGSNLAPTLNLDPFNTTGGPNDSNFEATFTGSAIAITAPNASGFDPNNSGQDIETITISVVAPNGNNEVLSIGGTPFSLGTASSGTVTIGSTTFAVSVAVSGTTATLTITRNGGGDLSNAAVSALLQSLQYNNTASSPNTAPRVFSFVANDGVSDSNIVTSTVSLNVPSVNNPPIDANETLSVAEDNPLSGNLLSNASDPDGNPLSITQFTIGSTTYTAGQTAAISGVGTLTINADGTFTFNPAPNYNGSVPPVSYTVSDGNGSTDTSTLSITVTGTGGSPSLMLDLDADDSSSASGRDYQTRFVKGFPVSISDIDLTISGANNPILQQAVITLVNRPNGTSESLAIRGALPPGITASAYNPATGQLILSGAASLADYKLAIATIVYNNSARSVDTASRSITVVVSNGTVTSPPATTTISIASQNATTGSSGADVVIGTDGDDILNGFSDRDGLYGRGGNDILNGGSDPDTLRGDGGNDILNGGTGNDDLDGGDGNDIINGGGGHDLIHGRAGDDLLNGGRGRDRIFGGTGRDTLNGGEGNDLLVGDEGDDIINGGRGNDRIIGGVGRDRLIGGQGNDLFIYRSKAEFGDTITDFEIVRDRIDLRAIFRGRGSMSNIRLRQVGADTQVDVKIGGQFATLGVLEAVNANTLQARHFIF